MRTKFKAVAMLAALAAWGVGAASAQECKPKYIFDTVAHGKLTVALTNTPPYSSEKNGAISGIDGELLTRFAKENCVDITYEIFTYPAAVSAVQSKRADVAIGGFYRTSARERVVALSTPVYLDQLAVASREGFQTVDDLQGKKVGTVEGYLWVSDMEKLYPGSRTYPNSLNLAQDLQAKRIDAGLDGFGASVLQNQGTDVKVRLLKADPRVHATLDPSQTSFLLGKTNEKLVTAVDSSIDDYRKSGAIADALKAYDLDPSAADVGEARVIK